MMQTYTITGKYADALITGAIDEMTTSQVIRMINSQAINGHVAIMPDGHAGKGSVVGFTMKFRGKVCPNTVGVDIGCGVSTYRFENIRDLAPKQIYDRIRRNVPTGFHVRDKPVFTFEELDRATRDLRHEYCLQLGVRPYGYEQLARKIHMKIGRMLQSIGTLGGGNHFIEIGEMRTGYGFTIHTGSRNFGLTVCNYHQKLAIEHMKMMRGDSKSAKVKALKRRRDAGEFDSVEMGRRIKGLQSVTGVPKDLEYLEQDEACQYLYDMWMAQLYADLNRLTIAEEVARALRSDFQAIVTSVHNWIDPEDMIIRKGAIRAYKGMTVAIPINRTEGTWICEVTDSSEAYNFSLPHGAGRTGSRTAAKRVTTQEMADQEMKDAGIYSEYNPRDETDSSYKSSASILESIKNMVTIVDTIRPIVNIK